jgi:hypothetical protein
MGDTLLECYDSFMGRSAEIMRPSKQRGVVGIRRRYQIEVAHRTPRCESIIALAKLQSSGRHDESIPREGRLGRAIGMPLKSAGISPLFCRGARQDLPTVAELAWNVMQEAMRMLSRLRAKRDILAL